MDINLDLQEKFENNNNNNNKLSLILMESLGDLYGDN